MNEQSNQGNFETQNLKRSNYSNDENLQQQLPSSSDDAADHNFFLNPENYSHFQQVNKLDDKWNTNNNEIVVYDGGETSARKVVKKNVDSLEVYTSMLCDNDIDLALQVVEQLQTRLKKKIESVDKMNYVEDTAPAIDNSKDTEIVNNVSNFLNLSSMRSKGRYNKYVHTILRGIWCSVSGGNISTRFLTKRLLLGRGIGSNNKSYALQGSNDRKVVGNGNNIFAKPLKQKDRSDRVFDIAGKYIDCWQHDENVSMFESNSNAQFKVLNPQSGLFEEHKKRSYTEKGGLKVQFSKFSKSDFFKAFVNEVMNDENKKKSFASADKQPSIGMETFRRCLCKCIGNPTSASCVDIRQDKVFLSGIAMEAFIHNKRKEYEKEMLDTTHSDSGDEDIETNNESENESHDLVNTECFFSKLDNCKCSSCNKYIKRFNESPWTSIFKRQLNHSIPFRLVNKCMCKKESRPDLKLSSDTSCPRFHKWNCATSKCTECGIDTLPWDCEVLANCNIEIPIDVWEDSARTGQQTQLEIVQKVLPVNKIMPQLKDALKTFMQHHVDLQLFRRMKDLDVETQSENALLIFTDFAAMSDYRANKTVCGSIDHHGVLQDFYVLSNPRDIEIIKDNGTIEVKKVRDCEVFYIFGGTEDRGKKHDWVFHTAGVDHIIGVYKKRGLLIKYVRIYTDNCGGQYKCRQNFNNLSMIPVNYEFIVYAEHLFAPVHGFKGPWDAAGKVAKYLAKRLEREGIRVKNAFDHFLAMAAYLLQVDIIDWELLEHLGAEFLLSLTPFTATKRHAVYATDQKDEFDRLKEEHKDIIFIDRKNREINGDCEVFTGSESCFHVIANGATTNGETQIEFREKFCFCQVCASLRNDSASLTPRIGSGCRSVNLIGTTRKFKRRPTTDANLLLVNKFIGCDDLLSVQKLLSDDCKVDELKLIARLLDIKITKDVKRADGKKN